MGRIKTQGTASGGDRMTSKEKPLAGAMQAQQQGASNKASNLYLQNTHSIPAGQGKQSFNNPAWPQGKRILSLSFHSPTSNLFLISGFVVKSARGAMTVLQGGAL